MSYSFSVRTFDAWNIAITLINGESDHVRIAYLFAGHFSKVCNKPSSHEAGNLQRLYMNKRTTYIHKHNISNNLKFLSIANDFFVIVKYCSRVLKRRSNCVYCVFLNSKLAVKLQLMVRRLHALANGKYCKLIYWF